MQKIKTNELGFAGFLMIQKLQFVGFNNNEWVFESEKSLQEWRADWINSDFMKFDKFIQELKKYK